MDKKESFYWDLVKGTAVFLMLWGHCIQYCALDAIDCFEDVVYKTIYSFHMPVFMLVSGYLFAYSFRKRDLPQLLEHRIRGMLHPIVMATILSNILMLIPTYLLSDRADILFGSLFMGIGDYFWFLWAVLYCSLLVAVCCKCTDKLPLQICFLLAGGFAILLLPQWNTTLFMYPYFVAGYFSGMYRKQAKKLHQYGRYICLFLFPLMVSVFGTKHYIYITPMFSQELGLAASGEIALFRWAIGFVGSIWLLTILEFLLSLGSRLPALQSCLGAVACLGRNSLQIYCLSLSLLTGYLRHFYRKLVEVLGSNLFAANTAVYDFLFTPLLAVCWSVFLYGTVLLLKKWKLHKLIFGR